MPHPGITLKEGTKTMKLWFLLIVAGSLSFLSPVGQAPQRGVIGPGQFASRVRINPGQARLFNDRAGSFEKLAASTRTDAESMVGKGNLPEATKILFGGLSRGKSAVESMKVEFEGLRSKEDSPDQHLAAEHFFTGVTQNLNTADDVIKQYGMTKFSVASDATFTALNNAATVFKAVAGDESLTFDLDVNSVPQEGDVSYKRTGEPYTQHPKSTDTTIPNLEYAVWTVRVVKAGYQPQEKQHNPFREPNHVLHFTLVK
jgi:hypothetical protein